MLPYFECGIRLPLQRSRVARCILMSVGNSSEHVGLLLSCVGISSYLYSSHWRKKDSPDFKCLLMFDECLFFVDSSRLLIKMRLCTECLSWFLCCLVGTSVVFIETK